MNRANSEQLHESTFGLDLFVALDRRAGLARSLEEALRSAIAQGTIGPGTRLPSTRALARDLGVSRGVAAEAYGQLAAGGFVTGRRGSGTVVAEVEPAVAASPAPTAREPRHDLRPGRPDPTSFPREVWVRALRRALAAAPGEALGIGDPQGRVELRSELASYLARARGLRADATQIVVTAGFTQGLAVVARTLAALGGAVVAMEDPCMAYHRQIVAAAGLEVRALPVDGDGGRVEKLRDEAAVVLTPNRHHPLGMPLAGGRRGHVLEWARARGSLVVEDDYDGEFRYDAAPLVALQALDPHRVVYAGTTSKTLAPGVRIGWLVVPRELVGPVVEQKLLVDWQPGVLDQLALAELVRRGELDRHVRRMRLRYRHRRDALVGALEPLVGAAAIGGTAAGLNLHVALPDVAAEQRVLAAAADRGVAVEGLATGGYPHGPAPSRAGILVGYAAAPEHAFPSALDALVRAFAAAR